MIELKKLNNKLIDVLKNEFALHDNRIKTNQRQRSSSIGLQEVGAGDSVCGTAKLHSVKQIIRVSTLLINLDIETSSQQRSVLIGLI
jgi:hypothetical protein